MMGCSEPNRIPIRRCGICGLTYHQHQKYAKCANCGEPTEVMCVLANTLDGFRSPTTTESDALVADILAEQLQADLAAGAAAEAAKEANERRIRAATAALRYDLDHWDEVDPATWGPAAELGG